MNDPALQKEALRLFDECCDLPEAERAAFLDRECPDAALRETVEAMLASDEEEGSFLDETHAVRALDEMAASVLGDQVEAPSQIGPYRIVREVARGGMGIIYEAQQDAPDRRVALKVLQSAAIDRAMLRRFQQEAQVLGQLQHPSIAQVYEAGFAETPQGRQPFFAMEFINGVPLDVHVRTQQLGTRQRLELAARVCDAVQHAHQKGIIHRDLKPANVLVLAEATGTHADARSVTSIDAIGLPKVLDFGIARITDPQMQPATLQTEVGQLVGTLAYMSPEQLVGDSSDLDTRCDVYALGVMMYEILADRRPHDLSGMALAEAARRVQEDDPVPLGQVVPGLRGDVETIVSKTLEKDRERRYGSAADLAADIRRYLNDEPVLARPATTMYLLSRFVRRNRGLVGGAVTAVLMLIVALIGTGYGLVQAESQRKAAVAANEQLQTVIDYQSAMLGQLDVEQMGQRWVANVRREAARIAEQNPQTGERLIALESLLAEINATTLASRVLDESILTRAVAVLDSSFAEQPQLQADLRGSLVEIYQQVGLRPEALAQARQQYETCKLAYGAAHPKSLSAQQHVVDLLLQNEAFEEARAAAEQLLGVQEQVLGEDSLETLRTRRLYGVTLRRLTQSEEALQTLEDVLARYEKTVGPDHEETMQAMLDLGDYHLQERAYETALKTFQTVWTWREQEFGPDDPDTLTVLARVANVLFLLNDFATALPLFERQANALQRTLGEDHPTTLAARYRLANVLTERGDVGEAEAVLDDTLQRQKRVLGRDHPARVTALSAGLRFGLRTQRWDLAEAYGEEALDIARRTLGPDNVRTLDAQHDLVAVYLKSEQHDVGAQLGRVALAEYQRVLGPDHPRTATMHQTLGKVLISAGMYEEAADELARLVEICRRVHAKAPVMAGTLGQAVAAMCNAGRGEEAEACARDLLAWCSERGLNSSVLMRCHLWVARAQFAQGHLDDAQASLQQARELVVGTSFESAWPGTVAKAFQALIDLQRDPARDPELLLALYQTFRTQAAGMKPEDRNPILYELQQAMAALDLSVPSN